MTARKNELLERMAQVVAVVSQMGRSGAWGRGGDAHRWVCSQVAEQFDLWSEPDAEGLQSFPLWLSFLVQGIGREEGWLE